METPTKPLEHQVKQTIQDIQKRLADPLMKLPRNRPVREGYTEAVNILVEGRTTYDEIQGSTVQGRAIAVLAVDYLNGEQSKEVLCGVPLKRP